MRYHNSFILWTINSILGFTEFEMLDKTQLKQYIKDKKIKDNQFISAQICNGLNNTVHNLIKSVKYPEVTHAPHTFFSYDYIEN